jgi:hypothetical protein
MVTALIVLAGCGRASREKAEAATAQFHRQLQLGASSEIYISAAPEFRASLSETDFRRFVANLNARLGVWRSSGPPSWNLMVGTNGTSVTLKYDSEFERDKATEQFVWRIEGELATLVNYNINSRGLLLN